MALDIPKFYIEKRDPCFKKVLDLKKTEEDWDAGDDENELEETQYWKVIYKEAENLNNVANEYLGRLPECKQMVFSEFVEILLSYVNIFTDVQDAVAYPGRDGFNLSNIDYSNSQSSIVDQVESINNGEKNDVYWFAIGPPGEQEGPGFDLVEWSLSSVARMNDYLTGKIIECEEGQIRVVDRFSLDEINDGQYFFQVTMNEAPQLEN